MVWGKNSIPISTPKSAGKVLLLCLKGLCFGLCQYWRADVFVFDVFVISQVYFFV